MPKLHRILPKVDKPLLLNRYALYYSLLSLGIYLYVPRTVSTIATTRILLLLSMLIANLLGLIVVLIRVSRSEALIRRLDLVRSIATDLVVELE